MQNGWSMKLRPRKLPPKSLYPTLSRADLSVTTINQLLAPKFTCFYSAKRSSIEICSRVSRRRQWLVSL